jgi:hypothetical protein
MITGLENFTELEPFFRIIDKGLDGLVDGRRFFDLRPRSTNPFR